MTTTEDRATKALRLALEKRKAKGRAAFGTLRLLPSGRLQARYVGPDDQRHTAPRTYETITDAEAYLRRVQGEIDSGAWESRQTKSERKDAETRDSLTLRPYAEAWLSGRDLKPRTKAHYRRLLDTLILPAFGEVEVRSITPSAVRAWHAQLPEKPTLRAHTYSLLRAICTTAVAEEVLDANPCRVRGAGNAKRVHEIEPLSLAELEKLVIAMPEKQRALILLASWCALRFGELAELRRLDLVLTRTDGELVAGVIKVRRAMTRVFDGEGHGQIVIGKPKSDAGTRDVAIPPHLLTAIEDHFRLYVEPGREALLFPGAGGSHLAPSALYGKAPKVTKNRRTGKTTTRAGHGFYAARIAAGRPDLRLHDLRHTGAVLAAQTGATLAELMGRLGHSTPGAALRYQHAAAGRDAEIARRLSVLVESQG